VRILIIASGNSSQISPFVKEQAESLVKQGLSVDFFLIKGKGLFGYLRNYFLLIKKIKHEKYDLIHAHYGLSGLLATMQLSIPVVITFHGSDVNMKKNYLFSRIASRLSAANIFVHQNLPEKLRIYRNPLNIIPCGFDNNLFFPIPKDEARKTLKWEKNKRYIVFSSAFDNKIKNVQLAWSAISGINNCNLIELKGYGKEKINLILNASDLLLVTSLSETGPIIVKEALACNCPIISTDVGDVQKLIKNVRNCYISSYNPDDIKKRISLVFRSTKRTNGEKVINNFKLENIAYKVIDVYRDTLKNYS
tara:strand:- start:2912 stop:3832 length:921 start_codon:yes stop_codon:yes gene_type:complete